MTEEEFEIAYAAHTASCTFLLDGEGICRRIAMNPHSSRPGRASAGSRNASRCVGAQYVASLDAAASGCLVEMPRIGASMLFARVDDKGRVSLVRTGVITKFEQMREEHDPFESVSVKTSAPMISPRASRPGESPRPAPPPRETARMVVADPDPDYNSESDADRTQPFQAMKHGDIRRALGHAPPADEPELKTAEYTSQPGRQSNPAISEDVRSEGARSTLPSQVPATSQGAPTLRRAVRIDTSQTELEEQDPYVERARGMLPRRNEAAVKRQSAPRQPRAEAWQGEPKVAARRRDR